MRILIIILLTLFSSKSFAKDETNWLMNDSLSMFEWGMLQLDKKVEEYIKEEKKQWAECSDLIYSIETNKTEIKRIKNKNKKYRTHEEAWKFAEYTHDKTSFDISCKHYSENGKIINYDIVYDVNNDKIYIIFGQNVLHNPSRSNRNWDNFEEDVSSKLINSEKCIFNRNKIASDLFFYKDVKYMELLSESDDNAIDDREKSVVHSGLNFFFHRNFRRPDEPSNLKSHLYSIVNVGVLLGSGFGNEKAIFCWESLRSVSPSIKIGELKSVMKEVFFGLHKDSIFLSR